MQEGRRKLHANGEQLQLQHNLYNALKNAPLSREYLFSKHSTFTFPMTKQGAPLYVRYQWLIALIANYFNVR